MPTELDAKITITSWDENPVDDAPEAEKITRASVKKDYAGDITGSSMTEWVMAYAPDKTATFLGVERITGAVDGKDGTLVLQHSGRFEDGAATASITILRGTGDLAGAAGTGEFVADPEPSLTLTLD